MLNFFSQFDNQLTNFINQSLPRNAFFDFFFSFFSGYGFSIFVWIVIILLVIIIEEVQRPGIQKTDKIFVLYFLISFLTTTLVVNIILKNLIQRPRPSQLLTFNFSASTCPGDFSFPSGHAATAFAAATVLSAFDKKRKKFYYLVAFIISLSRIYLGCHFFLDIFFGGLIGYLITKTYLFLLPKLMKL